MCKIAKVSKSGYYKWLKNKDKISFSKILEYAYIKEIFFRKQGQYGIRNVKMALKDDYNIIMSRKKIAKIMKELNLITKTRRQNPYKRKTKDNEEKFYCENILNRNFKNRLPYEALGINITYLKYNGRFGYLCVLLDVKTTEAADILLENEKTKNNFIKLTQNIRTLFKAILPDTQAKNYAKIVFVSTILYAKIKESTSEFDNNDKIKELAAEVEKLLNESIKLKSYEIKSGELLDLSKIDFEELQRRILKEKRMSLLESLKNSIDSKISDLLKLNS